MTLTFRFMFYILMASALISCGGGSSSGGGGPAALQEQTLSFDKGELSLIVGASEANPALVQGSGEVSYRSSDESIVTVDASGVVTAVGSGKASITASINADASYEAATSSYEVTVDLKESTSLQEQTLSFSKSDLSLVVGGIESNPATSQGSGVISYSSSDETIVTVDDSGTITALSHGNVTIYASIDADDSYLAAASSYGVTVEVLVPPVTQVTRKVSRLPDVPKVVPVLVQDVPTEVPVLGEAETKIAPSPDTQKSVDKLRQTLSFNERELVLVVGESKSNLALVQGTGVISYRSSEEAIATVDSAGLVTAIGAGRARIIASIEDDDSYGSASSSYEMTVVLETQTLSFNERELVLVVGESESNLARVEGTGAISYRSSDVAIATVDGSGLVTAIGAGRTTITAFIEAGDSYGSASSHYDVSIVSASFSLEAWVGSNDSKVTFSSGTEGIEFYHGSDANCDLHISSASRCLLDGQEDTLDGFSSSITDTAFRLEQTGYYQFQHGTHIASTTVSVDELVARTDHAAVSFKGKLWVIGGVGDGSVKRDDVWSSTDGTNWTLEKEHAEFSPRNGHQVVVFDNKLWLIGGADDSGYKNDTWISTDGVSWTQRSASADFSARRNHQLVVHRDRLFLIGGVGGGGYTNEVWVSSDGIGWWPLEPSELLPERAKHGAVSFNDKLWVIGGYSDSQGMLSDVWSSEDGGVTWDKRFMPPFEAREGHSVVVYDNKLWVVGGSVGADGRKNDIWSSVDGMQWNNAVTFAPFTERTGQQVVVHEDKLFLIGGSDGSVKSDVWFSSDGEHWDSKHFPARNANQVVVFKDKLWVIGGTSGDSTSIAATGLNDVWSSEDGINWHLVTAYAEFGPRHSHQVAVFKGELWVIGGLSGGRKTKNIFSSKDGVHWDNHGDSGIPSRHGHKVTVMGGKMWLVGGDTGTERLNDVWSSTNGEEWDRVVEHAAFSERYNHSLIAFEGKLWIFGGRLGLSRLSDVWSSEDGIVWTEMFPGEEPFGQRKQHDVVVFDNKLWLVGGDQGGGPVAGNDVYTMEPISHEWKKVADNAEFGERARFDLVVYKEQVWVIGGGYRSNIHNNSWTSEDGAEWRRGYSETINFNPL